MRIWEQHFGVVGRSLRTSCTRVRKYPLVRSLGIVLDQNRALPPLPCGRRIGVTPWCGVPYPDKGIEGSVDSIRKER